jgi:YVTN family beta-propeller protein
MLAVIRRLAAPAAFFAFALTPPAVLGQSPPAPGVVFEAPAGLRPAGEVDTLEPYTRILPSGRLVSPAGKSVVTGMGALGVALSPDDRFAVVTNGATSQSDTVSALDGITRGGSSLAVIDTTTLEVVSRYRAADEGFFAGIVALRDPLNPQNVLVLASGGARNLVYAFDLDSAGRLTRDARHTIPVPPSDLRSASAGHAFPSTIALAPDGSRAYVVDEFSGEVIAIDPATRATSGTAVPVGFFPFGAVVSRSQLIVANEGLGSYTHLADPAMAPPFETVPEDLQRASSLSFISLDAGGAFAPPQLALALDRRPDGFRMVGGAQPAALVAMRTKPFAFVAMSNVDRIAAVSLAGPPVVVGGTEMRLFDRGPYGTQPSALVLSKDEKRLYVALAGINAIAVLDSSDPRHLHRLGLIPTGWYPTALALSHDGRTLFVVNAKGIGQDRGFMGERPSALSARGNVLEVAGDASAVWSTLQRIDLGNVDLRVSTAHALEYQRTVRSARHDRIVPLLGTARSRLIRHVVVIVEASKTYDAMLGDLTDASGAPYGPGDPGLVAYDAGVTPNLHALAATFGLAGNFYSDAAEAGPGTQFAGAGIASLFTERGAFEDSAAPYGASQDPEDYPRSGYVFNALALLDRSFRDYGEFVAVTGYEPDAAAGGLGGRFTFDTPAPLALAGHVDLQYPGFNPHVRDAVRASEFVHDFGSLVQAGQMPDFTYVSLPGDRGVQAKDLPPLSEQVADGDRALGTIVAYLTHLPQWNSTAIFIMPSDSALSRDHVNVQRSYAIVVSPYAKRHFLGMRHISTAGVLKTEEEILGLPPLALGDALATDLSDFFAPKADPAPFEPK